MISGIVIFATVLAATNVESQCKDGTCPADAVPEKPLIADAMPGCAIKPGIASAINWGNNLVPATSDAEKIKDMIA